MIERVIKYAIPLLVFLLPACSQEDEPGAALRPMEFSVTISDPPLSRVSETADGMGSTWSKDDKILVNVTQGGTSSTTTCTLNVDGTIAKYNPTLFWEGNSATISAYYSNIKNCKPTTDKTVDLADQRNGLAYMLYTQSTAAQRKSNIVLRFFHRLAKVRIKVEGEKAQEVTAASINNYTSCTVDDDGNFTKRTSGYIQMQKNGGYFEANVLPTDEIPEKFISFGDDFEVAVSGITSLEAGKVYTITMDATSGASSSVETEFGGHPAVLMRGGDDPLYVAKMNIGATFPQEHGLYFWWGDTNGVDRDNTSFNFDDEDNHAEKIITYNKSIDDLWKEDEGVIRVGDYDSWLDKPYDAASVKWGSDWRLPSQKDFQWLIENCDWEYVDGSNDYYTVEAYGYIIFPSGYKVTSKTTNGEIFLPLGGRKYMTSVMGSRKEYEIMVMSTEGYYWTCNPCNNSTDSYALFMTDNTHENPNIRKIISLARYYGCFIRPISYGQK